MDRDANRGGTGGAEVGDDDGRRQEVMDNLAAAVEHLKSAVKDLGDEVEKNARAEWVRAQPDLRSSVGDLQSLVDSLAARARVALDDLGNRLDPPESREGR